MSFNKHNKLQIVWKFEARCTLHDVIGNGDFDLNEEFQISFISDIVKVEVYSYAITVLGSRIPPQVPLKSARSFDNPVMCDHNTMDGQTERFR